MERLRELVGQNELQNIIRGVAAVLSQSLESGYILFYLRNGLFCISSVNLDPIHALGVAQAMHEQGKRRSVRGAAQQAAIQMRSCVVRAPQDVHDIKTLSTFVRRLGHLMPESGVATYEELSRKEDFALNMALSDCIARAIKERSFEVYYQPIFCVKENCFHSGEALVRLNDPAFGFVPPSLFIPEAEQSGAISRHAYGACPHHCHDASDRQESADRGRRDSRAVRRAVQDGRRLPAGLPLCPSNVSRRIRGISQAEQRVIKQKRSLFTACPVRRPSGFLLRLLRPSARRLASVTCQWHVTARRARAKRAAAEFRSCRVVRAEREPKRSPEGRRPGQAVKIEQKEPLNRKIELFS